MDKIIGISFSECLKANIINIGSFKERWKWCVQNLQPKPCDIFEGHQQKIHWFPWWDMTCPCISTSTSSHFPPRNQLAGKAARGRPGTCSAACDDFRHSLHTAQNWIFHPKKRLLMIALVVFSSAWTVIHTYVSLQIGYVQINFASTGVNIERCKLYCCIRKCIVQGWSCTIVSIRHHCFRLTCEKQNLQLLVDIIRYPLMSIQSLHCLCRASQLWMKASWMRAAVQMYSFLCPSNPIHGIIELEANGRCSWNCEHVTPKMTLRAIARGGNKTQQHHMKQRFNQCRDTFRATETNEQIHTHKGSIHVCYICQLFPSQKSTDLQGQSVIHGSYNYYMEKSEGTLFFDPPFLNAWLHGLQHPKTQRLRTTRTVVSTGPGISLPICDVNKTWQASGFWEMFSFP